MTAPTDLASALAAIDPTTRSLAKDESCEWARTHAGIVGLVRLPLVDAEHLGETVGRVLQKAYSVLDGVPETELPAEDLWNVTLLIEVPLTEDEALAKPEIYAHLSAVERDTTGARKILLWRAEGVGRHFGRLRAGGSLSAGALSDPLNEVLDRVSRDETERDVLRVLFKRKLGEEDIDELVRVLGKRRGHDN